MASIPTMTSEALDRVPGTSPGAMRRNVLVLIAYGLVVIAGAVLLLVLL